MIKIEDLHKEVKVKAVRSSGSGGQHVNKTSTKAEIYLDVDSTDLFTDDEKAVLKNKLSNRINRNGIFEVTCQEWRSLYKNKEKAIEKMFDLIEAALEPDKPRIATKPSKASKERRLREKTANSLKKLLRRNDFKSEL